MNKIPFSVYDFFGYLASGFLLLAAADYAFGWNWLASKDLPIGVGLAGLLGAYLLGHLVAHLSSVLIELNFLRKVLGSPEDHLFVEPRKSIWRNLFPGNFQPFPKETKDRILERAKKAGIHEPGRALFFHCRHLVKKDKATLERLNTFLNLYGFSRNITMALVLSAVVLIIGGIRDTGLTDISDVPATKFLGAAVCMFAAYGMFLRYLKFFRHYTDEVFLSYAESNDV